jgi:hypothetical protein
VLLPVGLELALLLSLVEPYTDTSDHRRDYEELRPVPKCDAVGVADSKQDSKDDGDPDGPQHLVLSRWPFRR